MDSDVYDTDALFSLDNIVDVRCERSDMHEDDIRVLECHISENIKKGYVKKPDDIDTPFGWMFPSSPEEGP